MRSDKDIKDSVSEQNLRDSLRRIIVAWLFGAAWMYLASGASFTRYAKLLNVSHFGFGVLATVPFLGALVQLPASLLLERYGGRKTVFLWCASISRALWLVIAALPWLFPPAWQWPALLATMLLSTVLANITSPAWMTWMGELIPGRIRGRYFSRRTQLGQAVGLVLSILSGLALDWPGEERLLLRNVIAGLFALAAVFGVADILMFLRVPDPARAPIRPSLGFRDLVRAPLADRNFRRLLGFSFTMTFATGYIGQFVWLYLFDVAGMGNSRANVMLVTLPLVVGMVCYPFWGRMVDRFGSKPVLVAAGLLVINGATGWIFVTRENWVWGYLLVLLSTAAWPGMDIAGFNLLLRMAEGGAQRRTSNTAVIAINSVVVAVAGTLSGLFGGAVAERLGDGWHATLGGCRLTYHGVLFIGSGVLRAAALVWLIGLKEPERKVATREALEQMASGLYSNLLQATFFPARVMMRLARTTWKISAGKTHHKKS
jgi:MFS family permease